MGTQESSAAEAKDGHIGPFSLIGHDVDIPKLCEDIESRYGLNQASIEDIYPCTPLQEGLLSLAARRNDDYVLNAVLELAPDVQVEKFCLAWEQVVREAPILRTRIVQQKGFGLLQVVLKEEIQWVMEETDHDEVQAQGLVTAFGKPLSRYAVVKHSSSSKHWFIWTIHHALFDRRYSTQLTARVNDLYLGRYLKEEREFKTFVKYTLEQNCCDAIEYWRSLLQGCESRQFPSTPTIKLESVARTTIERTYPVSWGKKRHVRRSILVTAAWALVVSRFTGSNDVVFGTILSGQNALLDGTKDIAGPTIATVPVRAQICDDDELSTFLERIRDQATERIPYEHTGIQNISKASDDARDACRFENLLVIQAEKPYLSSDVKIGEWTTKGVNSGTYLLEIECFLLADGIRLVVNFNPHSLEMWKITRVLEYFGLVVEQLVQSEPSQHLTGISRLSPEDLEQLWQWNGTLPLAAETCVHHLIAERTEKQPDAPAICSWDGELSYYQLDELSTKVAQRLVGLGVGKDTIVPLCFEKSMWMPVAMLAVMKAGGASVAIDTAQPEERLWSIIHQVQPDVILSSPKKAHLAGRLKSGTILCLDSTVFTESYGFHEVKLPPVDPSATIYIVFTSGSTGTPKGSIITHRNVTSAIRHQQEVLGFKPSSRVFDFASYSFDVAWENIVQTLTSGACLCIPNETDRKEDMASCMVKLNVNFAILTPSAARLISPQSVPCLQTLILGGERITDHESNVWASQVQMINGYGPSECTTVATCSSGTEIEIQEGYIGRGYGVNTWVVHPESKELALIGAVGELWLEGPLVGQGYLHDPERTMISFVHDPAWLMRGGPGCSGRRGRLYRTGDLVRYNQDGTLVFCGRKDAQVKIRGQRVELEEVEHHIRQVFQGGRELATIPAVVEVVTPRDGSNPILVLYLAIGEKAAGSKEVVQAVLQKLTDGLDDQLAEFLPPYMIPGAFIAIEKVPMTVTGKTDRRRLREMGGSLTLEELTQMHPLRGDRRVPATAMEHQLQSLWAAVLGLKTTSIGADDSFLRIGGDSIRAMKLVGAARERGLSLTVADVFRKPRLSDLAKLVKSARSFVQEPIATFSLLAPGMDMKDIRQRVADQCQIDTAQVEDVFPCTPLQEGLLALTSKRPGDFIARTVWEIREEVNIDRFKRAWEEVVATTPILRTRIIDLQGQGLVQVVVCERVRWIECGSLEAYFVHDKQQEMDLGKPLVYFGLVHELEKNKWLFVRTLHHALYDGWSLPLILDEVYRAYSGGGREPLAPFKAFVKHATRTADDADVFWEAELAGSMAIAYPSLPSPDYQPHAECVLKHTISCLQWPENDITASTAVRASWAILMAWYTYSQDVIFGATVTGRQAPVPGVERMAGPTFATVPVRVRLDWTQSISKFLQRVQEQAVAMAAYEQTGLQRIRRISIDTDRGSHFQTLLVIQPQIRKAGVDDNEDLFTRIASAVDCFNCDSLVNTADAFNIYALMLGCQLMEDGIQLHISYDSRVIESMRIGRLAYQLEHVLRQVCAKRNEQLPLTEIETTSQEDLRDIWRWNATVPEGADACVHDLIAQCVRQRPNAPAICAWDGKLTYSALEELSTQLAHHLITLGVQRGATVLLCLEKSMWMPVSMLGVIKAGGSSVAMDITQPMKRLQSIAHQVHPSVILSSTSAYGLSCQLGTAVVQVVDHHLFHSLANIESSQLHLPIVQSSDELYIAFTSGSTGTPKGVVITHRNFCSAIRHQQGILGFTSSDRVFDFASYAFDATWWNFLHPVTCGACLCIPSESERKDTLAACMKRMHVTYTGLTPSTARLIDPAAVPSLKTVVLGGEPVGKGDIAKWGGNVQVKTIYGPAECTPNATIAPQSAELKQDRNIGRGQGLVTWIVGDTGLVPVGAVGELWLEGPLVGPGYLHNPEKTATSFVHDPAWLMRGGAGYSGRHGRLYRTGDLVRYNLDGTLVFCGRKDTQVKIRGQRVELEEVEHHVQQNFSHAEHVVADVLVWNASQMAAAFILCNRAIKPLSTIGSDGIFAAPCEWFRSAVSAARERLNDIMPSYMVPSLFIPLCYIPLTSTGKTNRLLLRMQVQSLSQQELKLFTGSSLGKRQPSTVIERKLQQLWAQVLNIEPAQIGADDTFFWLGGDSISAMQLAAKCRSVGLFITVSHIFQHKSISRLALCSTTNASPMAAHEEFNVSFGLSPIQQMFFDNHPGGHNHFNQSFLLRVSRAMLPADIIRSVETIVAQHSMLRARFRQAADGSWTQLISARVSGSYRYRQHELPSLEDATPVISESQLSLDIKTGPLFAVDFISTICDRQQYIFLVAHHLVIDLVSWRVVLGDLEELLTTDTLTGFAPLPFQAWCHLQAEYAQNDLTPEVAFPFCISPPPLVQDYWGIALHQNTFENSLRQDFMLDREVSDVILGCANNALRTQPVELLHAALIHSFLTIFRDRQPPSIFSEGHGRESWDPVIDLSRTVGWFTTVWPADIPINGQHSLTEIVSCTKDGRRRIPRNGWAYFASRYLNMEGKQKFQSHSPIEVSFNYQGLYQQFERPDALLQLADVPKLAVSDVAGDVHRFAIIDVSASVAQGRLQFNFTYNRFMKHIDSIGKWVSQCKRSLEQVAQSFPSLQPRHTLSDFPLLPLTTYTGLETLLNKSLPSLGVSATQVENIYPCSPVQQGMLLSQAKNEKHYKSRARWQVHSNSSLPIDVERLKYAWEKVVNRHVTLRTVFVKSVYRDAYLDQVVLKHIQPEVHVIQHTEADLNVVLTKHWENIHWRQRPLHSLVLYQTSDKVFFELLINHAIIDAASMRILTQDLCLAYDGTPDQRPSPLYSEYIQYVQGLPTDVAQEYWINYLKGTHPCIFPTLNDQYYVNEQTIQRSPTIRVDRQLSSKLHNFCKTHALTLSNLFQVAWGLVLRSYTGCEDLCFGYINSGRDIPMNDVEHVIGPLINTLVSRIELVQNTSLMTVMQKNQDDYLHSLKHQHYPLAGIVHTMNLSGQSLFNTVLSLHMDTSEKEIERSTIRLEKIEGEDADEYDVLMNINVIEEGVEISLCYCTSVLSNQQGASIVTAFLRTLSEIIDHPHDEVGNLDLLGEQDLCHIWEWNATVPNGVEACVHDLITKRAIQQPGAPAICSWDGELMYSELEGLSTRLAHHLITLGVKHGAIIPLCFEKSMWTTIAVLGVMKAGGASVAMDITQPEDRLRSIIQRVQPTLILSSAFNMPLASRLAAVQVQVVCRQSLNTLEMGPTIFDTLPMSMPSDKIYICFTSGSTGTPKGAVITHSNFTSAIKYQQQGINFTQQSRVFDFASYAFDVAWFNMLHTFTSGGCLCIPSQEERTNNLIQSIRRLEPSIAVLTPSVALMLSPSDVPSIRTLLLSGEQFHKMEFSMWNSRATVINSYGPVECTVHCTFSQVNFTNSKTADIGRGQGLVTWVVGETGLVPVGAVGELWLEGPLVGEGYLHDPEKTAASFVHDPPWLLRGGPGYLGRRGRLYRTGDLVRYNPDGTLVFCGRKDAQVKIHGQRVELEELEHHVRQSLQGDRELPTNPVVAEVVTPKDSRNPVLALYLVIGEKAAGSKEAVRTALQELTHGLDSQLTKLLPPYMIPGSFIAIDKIPMTATGKTDRRRLREIGGSLTLEELTQMHPLRGDRTAPVTKMECQVRSLWATVLGLEAESIGANDSFLRIGGDSIGAIRLVGVAREQGLSFTVADIFQKPQLSELAQVVKIIHTEEEVIPPFSLLRSNVDRTVAQLQVATQCKVQASQVEDIFPCTPLQEGLFALTAKRPGDYVARYVWEIQHDIDASRLRKAWEEVISTIPILRTFIADIPEQGLVQAIISTPAQWITTGDLEEYIENDRSQPLGLGDPLVRFGLIYCGNNNGQRRLFVWTLHHVLYDGWSLPLILNEVCKAYWGERREPLPPFQAFVKHTTQIADDAETFWQSQLAGSEAVVYPQLPLPGYQPRAECILKHTISDLQWPQNDITASTTVRASWAILMARYTCSHDVIFGATVTGRQAPVPRVELMAGPTFATVPVRIHIDWMQSVSEFLQQVQEQAVAIAAYEQTGLQRIRRIAADTELWSQFQTLLVLQSVAPTNKFLSNIPPQGLFQIAIESTETEGASGSNAFNTYALMLDCQLESHGLQLQISFDSQVIDTDQVTRLVHQLEHVLRQVCGEESERLQLTEIETTSEEDLHNIWGWNSMVPENIEALVHDLITQRAIQQPNAPAVCAWDGELTYGELEDLSTRLARYLITLGVRRGAIIPLCFEKSMWTAVAMLGIMKAGGASVAMDTTQPEDRLQSIIQRVQPTIILSSSFNMPLASRLATVHVQVVCRQSLGMSPTTCDPLPISMPSDKIYICFTSGSTGTPKGAVITHSNFASAIRHQQQGLSFAQQSRVFDFASYAFDAAWFNMLHTFASGGCLCIPSQEERTNNLIQSIRRLEPSIAVLTPSVALMLSPSDVPSIRTLVISGEQFHKMEFLTWNCGTTILNCYGPAECTVCSTFAKVNFTNSKTADIGRGQGLVTWVVGETGLVPVGAVGELWLEGPLVGEGYLHDPEKTATSFVHDPPWLLRGGPGYSGRHGRLYRTGDLVRYNPDGTLVFCGRKDAQVKIRGQRVELEELEHHVRQSLQGDRELPTNPVVAEVVTPRDSRNPVLALYLVIGEKAAGSKEAVQTTLQELTHGLDSQLTKLLPPYMIPGSFIAIDKIPMTATGKTDRRRLREIGGSLTLEELTQMHPLRGDRTAPATKMECQVRSLWATVLGLEAESIGANDSFLRIGGDSIGAIRLVGVAREQGLSFTVADIFQKPQLSELAQVVKIIHTEEEVIPPFSLLRSNVDRTVAQLQVATQCKVQASQVEDIFPCTPLQEGLFALTAKRPGDYVARYVWEIQHDIDASRLRKAWEEVISTIPILRTFIADIPEQGLVQAIISTPAQWITTGDLEEYIENDHSQPLGLGDPLVRFGLIYCGNNNGQRRLFVWTLHHVLYDGWSLPLILNEVCKAYWGERREPLPPFQAFVKHTTQIADDAETFWRSQLAGSEAVVYPQLPLPGYQPRAECILKHTISDLQWPRNDITASTTVRASWAILMARYTCSHDVIFGATVTGRQAPVPRVELMAGPTFATVPVRVHIDWMQSVSEFLQQVQEQAVAIAAYEQTGLQRIRRIAADTELWSQFQTLLVLQSVAPTNKFLSNIPPQGLFQIAIESTETEDAGGPNTFNTYALMLDCHLESHGLQLQISFDSQVIDTDQVTRLVHQLEHVLRQVCGEESERLQLTEIETTSEEDLHDIWGWNSMVPESVEALVHDLITQRAIQQPNAPAVCAWDGELTYSELEDLSTRLARYLITLGVRRGAIIPLCFEKSMWTAVAMLGVMKAGGASVAMDTTQPEDRLQSIIQRVQPTIILSSSFNMPLASRLATVHVQVVCRQSLGMSPTTCDPLPISMPSDKIYICFTSGSTGTPKGAVITHSNFASAIRYQQQGLKFTQQSRVFDFASYAFDVAWFNMLHTFTSGGCLCIPSQEERTNNLIQSIRRLEPSIAVLTPSVALMLPPSDVPSIRTLLLSGEQFHKMEFSMWNSGTTVINSYGPVECTVHCTFSTVNFTNLKTADIGRGQGLVTWVVGETGLVPVGAVGELWLEGPLVGEGYLHDPEKTATSFVHDPPWLLCGGPGYSGRHGRLYRTGDLVRYNPNGTLVFCGRKDAQVKIHGQRVELEEVEHHVRQNLQRAYESPTAPVVAEVVTPRDNGDPILVLYLAIGEKAAGSKEAVRATIHELTRGLRDQLTKSLPPYMIPGAFMAIDKIPMTATAKTDRRRLREIGGSFTLEELIWTQPLRVDRHILETETEHQVRSLWSAVLGLDPETIMADDSFLQIGGDSIKAMRFVQAARKQGLSLTVADVFQMPRLSDLAKLVKSDVQTYYDPAPFSLVPVTTVNSLFQDTSLTLPPHRNSDIIDILPVTDFQKQCISANLRKVPGWCPTFFVDFPSGTNIDRLLGACNELCQYLDILRTVFVFTRGQHYQLILSHPQPIIDVYRTGEELTEFSTKLYKSHLHTALALGQLFTRFVVITTSNGQTRLMIRLSHAQYDGLSLEPMMSCLAAFYHHQKPPVVPTFSNYLSYVTFHSKSAYSYWSSLLRGSQITRLDAVVEITDHHKLNYESRELIIFTEKVCAPRTLNNITPATAFTALCACAIANVAGTPDVVFGLVVSGRLSLPSTMQNTIGPCVNIIPIRVQLQDHDPLQQAVSCVHNQRMMSFPFESSQFGDIVKHCTNWPKETTTFGVYVQFQNLGEDVAMAVPGVNDKLGGVFTQSQALDTSVIGIFADPKPDGWQLAVTACRNVYAPGTIRKLLDVLAASIAKL